MVNRVDSRHPQDLQCPRHLSQDLVVADHRRVLVRSIQHQIVRNPVSVGLVLEFHTQTTNRFSQACRHRKPVGDRVKFLSARVLVFLTASVDNR